MSRRHLLGLFGAGGFGGLALGGLPWTVLNASGRTAPPPTPVPGAADATPSPFITVAEKAAELEFDVTRIFEFVRDGIAYEPYSGVLRGATGTLRSGAGNAADQAALLASLLEAAAFVPRFVEAPLDETNAKRLLDAAALDRAQADAISLRTLDAVKVDPGAPEVDAALQAELDRLATASRAVLASVDASVNTLADQLVALLNDAGVTLPEPAAAMPDLERTRHIWVQYADGPDWIDLDASAAWLEPGDSVATVGTPLGGIPDDWYHRVVLRVRVEELAGTGVSQRTLVEHAVRSADVVDTPISLVHAPPAAFADTGFAVVEALTGVARLYPTIVMGPDGIVDQPISIIGENGGGGLDDVFSDGTAATDTVAEWLDIEIHGPGAAAKVESRTIFDRAGRGPRDAGTITADTLEPVTLISVATAPDLGEFYPPLMAARAILLTGSRFVGLPAGGNAEENGLASLSSLPAAFRPMLDSAERQTLHTQGFRTVIESPCVVIATYSVTDGADANAATVGIDIVNGGTTVLPLTDSRGDRPGGVLAGVAAHVAERSLLDGVLAAPFGLEVPPRDERSVGRLFELAAASGVGFRVHQPSNPLALPDDASDDARHLMTSALDAGLIVVAPQKTIEIGARTWLGWWLVDPATGLVRDQFETGEGTALTDFGTILNFIVGQIPALKKLACAVAIAVFVAQCIAMGDINASTPTASWVAALGKTFVNQAQAALACY